ncbi:MAG: glycoside hydrolase family 2 [Alistipes sp.]|nr:glycoside hydrolase family 2 [Alistipes sp.]
MNLKKFAGAFLLLAVIGCTAGCGKGTRATLTDRLEEGFRNPPDSIQTSVYWYWISGNISAEGVVKDLESMKQAGINRAFIGNIGFGPEVLPQGPVKLFTEEWWHILHTALKKASELDIEIGIFNCPGWSQAGGPWIDPTQSMRYLACSSVMVDGGGPVEVPAPEAPEGMQDVKVLAIPVKGEGEAVLDRTNSTMTSTPRYHDAEILLDGDPSTGIAFDPSHNRVLFDITADNPFTLRSVIVRTLERPTRAHAELQVPENGGYRTIAEFDIDRTIPGRELGFDPYAPIVISTPAVTATRFRFVLSSLSPGGGISGIELSAIPKVERYPEKTLAKMFQSPLPYWQEYQWRTQPGAEDRELAVSKDEVLDITAAMSDGNIRWDAPEGRWEIMRLGMLPTGSVNSPAAGEGTGLEVDKLTSAFLRHHFDSFLGRIMERIPAEDRRTFRVVVADSYEKGGQNFTDTFLEDFMETYGYDALPYLPVYYGHVVGSREESDRFLWDLRRMVADKISYEHIGGMRKIAHDHGLTLWLENYGHWGFPGEFLQYGGQSDEIAGEFWSEGSLGDIENRAASSAAHIYGKTKVSAESFTCGGPPFSRYPAVMKPRGDKFFAEGINNTLLHLYLAQYEDPVPPGYNAEFGNEFNRMNTWFPHLDLFTSYLKRVNFMLQQGLNVADVAYFIGEDAPKMTGITDPPLPPGYQFDYINGEVILDRLTVRDGKLTLPHGTQYDILVLPPLATMRPELLEKIEELVRRGAAVLGPAPERSPSLEGYPESDDRVREASARLWGRIPPGENHVRVGQGVVMCGIGMEEALALTGCGPDFTTDKDVPVLYGHRTCEDGDIYFVSNQSADRIAFDAGFRVSGSPAGIWNPVDGSIRTVDTTSPSAGYTGVALELHPYESCFVVFGGVAGRAGRKPVPVGSASGLAVETVRLPVHGPWEVEFQSERRGPSGVRVFEQLCDLALSDEDSIRYYSGMVRYRKEIELAGITAGGAGRIYLGGVGVTAKVYVNGRYAGGAWTPPYSVDVTGMLTEGVNNIEIEVANTWVNRLIGDSRLPREQRGTYAPYNTWGPDSPLQMSGLTGPVYIEYQAEL